MVAKIIAHRGYSKSNDFGGIVEAFSRGFGAEFDIRDVWHPAGGIRIAVSHDPNVFGQDTLLLGSLLEYRLGLTQQDRIALPMAINIKSAGLGGELVHLFRRYSVSWSEYFLFDAAYPDMREMRKMGLRCFTRVSDEEPFPDNDTYDGILLDQFMPGSIPEGVVREVRANWQRVPIAVIGHSLRNPGVIEPGHYHELADYLITDVPERRP